MSDFVTPNDITLLTNLFKSPTHDSDAEEDEPSKNTYKAITPTQREEPKNESRRVVEDPFEESSFLDGNEANRDGLADWRKTPEWDISYRQSVSAEDVFLQMGAKTPSTASCEEMILTVHLPGEKRQNMDLKIEPTQLQLKSPNFFLSIPLPQPVDPKKGNAQYDPDTEKLKITLIMDREFDFVNF